MNLSTNRPGIYSQYTVSSGIKKKKAVRICALVLFLPDCKDAFSPGRLIEVSSMEDLNHQFVCTGTLSYLLQDPVKALLEQGAPKVYACVCNNQQHLSTCIQELEFCADIDIELIGTYDCSVISKMVDHLEKLSSSKKERIGIATANGVENALKTAKNMVSERLILVGQKSRITNSSKVAPMHEFSTALAIACAISQIENPPQNLNNLVLSCMDEYDAISDTAIEQCLIGGVTPIESVGDTIRCIKVLSTKTRQSQEGDSTFENISTTLTVDFVMQSIRNLLDNMLERAKNNRQTVEKISSQIIILLNELVDKEVLNSYSNPNVYFSKQDSGVCIIELKFKIACAINQICLTAKIIV